jgi:hypothetical protein
MKKHLFAILCACLLFATSAKSQVFDAHEISQSEATKLIAAFQSSNRSAWSVQAGTLPKSAIVALLSRKDAATLQYYWGIDEKNELQAIYVASKADNSNIIETNSILCPRRLMLHTEMDGQNILTVTEVVEMMRRYRQSPLFVQYKNALGGAIPRESILRLVKHPATHGIRSYFAMSEMGTPALVFVGTTATALDNTVLFVDRSKDCPPYCEPESQLVKLSSTK